MTGNVIRLDRPMRKHELVRHLESNHAQAIQVPIMEHRWTKAALVDLHQLIHFGLGR